LCGGRIALHLVRLADPELGPCLVRGVEREDQQPREIVQRRGHIAGPVADDPGLKERLVGLIVCRKILGQGLPDLCCLF
jgi:hypothetical protein